MRFASTILAALALQTGVAMAGEPFGETMWANHDQCEAAAKKLADALGMDTQALGEMYQISYPDKLDIEALCPSNRFMISSDAKVGPAILKAVAHLGEVLSGGDPASATAADKCMASMKPQKDRIGKIGLAHAREKARHPTYTYWGKAKVGALDLTCRAAADSRREVTFYYSRGVE